jgi:Protein of unknown function (DUF3168)
MSDPDFALQKAVVAALRADAALGALIGTAIYDDPPREAAFPYVSLGAASLADGDTASERGYVHLFHLDIWSRQGGRKEVRAILGAIEAVLHDASLALDGHSLVNLRFEFADIFRDEDGETMRGVVRYRAVTEPL